MKELLSTVFLISLFCCQGLAADNSVLLRYDDGVPEDGMWIDSNRGHAVLFTTPASNWTLSKVAISGWLNPESDQNLIVLEIWDDNFDLLYSRADNPKSYFGNELAWAEIDIPDITLSRNFLVCFFEFSNVYLGADLSNTSSGRSFIASRNPNRIVSWDLLYPSNKTDWSIVAVGVSVAPTVDLVLKPKDEAVIVEAMITDLDGDLARASMQIVDNKSLDVLWSEQRLIEGNKTNLTFIWPRELFQITNDTDVVDHVFAFNTVSMSPNKSQYLAYAVPCILKLAPNVSDISAAAYFGQDGEFHALIDSAGFTYYISRELLKVENPEISYGDYSKNNLTVIEGISSLSFFKLNLGAGMVTNSPLILTRSPLHHYKIKLEYVKASLGDYVAEVYVEDSVGKQMSKRTPIVSEAK